MLHKNNLTKHESRFIRNIFRSFPDLTIYNTGSELELVDKDGNFISFPNDYVREEVEDTINYLLRSSEDLRYLPVITTENKDYIITKIDTEGFWYNKPENREDSDPESESVGIQLYIEVRTK
jgi:hypothetical protein